MKDKFGREWELVTLKDTKFMLRELLMRLCFAIPISGALYWIAYNI